jgi:hypothetical protein
MDRKLDRISKDLKDYLLGRQISDFFDRHAQVAVQVAAGGTSAGIAKALVVAQEA